MENDVLHFDMSAGVAITLFYAASCIDGRKPKSNFFTIEDISIFLSILDSRLTANKALGDKKVFSHPKFIYTKKEMENDSYKDLLQAMRNFTIGCCDFDHHKTDFSSVIADAKNTKDKKIDESNTFHTYYKLARLKYNLVSEYNQARFNNTCCVIHGSTKFTPETNEEILNQLTNKLIGYYNEIPNPYESSIYKKIYIDIDSNKFIKSIKEAAGIFNNYCDNYIDIDQINSTFTDRIKINYNQKKHDEEESQRI